MSDFYRAKWERPFLTPSIARHLIKTTPLHARAHCPYFGGARPAPTRAMIDGTIVDILILGGDLNEIVVIEGDDFRSANARTRRDDALRDGLLPITTSGFERLKETANRVRGYIEEQGVFFLNGDIKIKNRLFWKGIGEVECSGEPDITGDGYVVDLKTTTIVPTADNWQRHANYMLYHVQAAAYLEATKFDDYRWLVVEQNPPHSVVLHRASAEFIEVGRRYWRDAQLAWDNCIRTGIFPGPISGTIEPESFHLDVDIKISE